MAVRLEASFEAGKRLEASIPAQPELSVASDAVSVPVATDYGVLDNKPRIEGVELVGDRSFEDLGLAELSNGQILEIWNRVQRSE